MHRHFLYIRMFILTALESSVYGSSVLCFASDRGFLRAYAVKILKETDLKIVHMLL